MPTLFPAALCRLSVVHCDVLPDVDTSRHKPIPLNDVARIKPKTYVLEACEWMSLMSLSKVR